MVQENHVLFNYQVLNNHLFLT